MGQPLVFSYVCFFVKTETKNFVSAAVHAEAQPEQD